MQTALDPRGRIVLPTRDVPATCEGCDEPVIAKLGEFVAHHWAHRPGADCARQSAPTSDWHLWWQQVVPPERREVTVGENREHRADVILPGGAVMEVQHSGISMDDVRARVAFYEAATNRRVIWVVDCRDADIEQAGPTWDRHWLWKRPRPWVVNARGRIYLDLGPDRGVLRVKRWDRETGGAKFYAEKKDRKQLHAEIGKARPDFADRYTIPVDEDAPTATDWVQRRLDRLAARLGLAA